MELQWFTYSNRGKGLHVFIDDDLTFLKHVLAAVLNVNQTFGIVKMIFDTIDVTLLPTSSQSSP